MKKKKIILFAIIISIIAIGCLSFYIFINQKDDSKIDNKVKITEKQKNKKEKKKGEITEASDSVKLEDESKKEASNKVSDNSSSTTNKSNNVNSNSTSNATNSSSKNSSNSVSSPSQSNNNSSSKNTSSGSNQNTSTPSVDPNAVDTTDLLYSTHHGQRDANTKAECNAKAEKYIEDNNYTTLNWECVPVYSVSRNIIGYYISYY